MANHRYNTGMKLYRFSPIVSEPDLVAAIEYLRKVCHQLCFSTFGRYLPVRGNVDVFAHYEDEFAGLVSLRENLTNRGVNYKNKYFKLHRPIVVSEQDGVPGATYDFLYIRRVDPYRSQVGDIDFVLPVDDHEAVKPTLNLESFVNGARLFGRPEENIIELWNPDVDAMAYIANRYMRDAVSVGKP